jgi:gamma-glutamyl-gamma-aminobutyraldehyde dehydrogenase
MDISRSSRPEEIARAAASLDLRTRAFIDGRFVDAASGRTFTSRNPATGRPVAEVAECGPEDVDRAVDAARREADAGGWSGVSPADRKRILIRFADLIAAHASELALIESLDAGKPIADTLELDIPETAAAIRWHAEAIDKVYDQVAPTGRDSLAMVVREPVGVVGAVVPWNYPAQMASWKLGPILATGNAVVIKPASQTSLSLLRMAELGAEAGLPAGVLNVVPGPGETVGEAIGRHERIDAVAFTGSTEVGRRFLHWSAESNLKRVVLELGGKSPQIVMADAPDLGLIDEGIADAIFWNMGENCSAGSRLIVHRSLRDELLDRLVDRVRRTWFIGDPLDPATRIGPIVSEGHMERVLDYIEIGRAERARVVTGGRRTREESGGYFVEPTIFADATNDMRIAQEEIFGPVLTTMDFETEEEAVAIANGTPYGLAASLYTTDLDRAHRMARALKAGTVSINAYSEGDMSTPFGGYKASGFGGHDKSLHAHDQYTELKTIWIALFDGRAG